MFPLRNNFQSSSIVHTLLCIAQSSHYIWFFSLVRRYPSISDLSPKQSNPLQPILVSTLLAAANWGQRRIYIPAYTSYTSDLVRCEDIKRQEGKICKWIQTTLEEWEHPGVGRYISAFFWLDNWSYSWDGFSNL